MGSPSSLTVQMGKLRPKEETQHILRGLQTLEGAP